MKPIYNHVNRIDILSHKSDGTVMIDFDVLSVVIKADAALELAYALIKAAGQAEDKAKSQGTES